MTLQRYSRAGLRSAELSLFDELTCHSVIGRLPLQQLMLVTTPPHIRHISSMDCFSKDLKTFLLTRAFKLL